VLGLPQLCVDRADLNGMRVRGALRFLDGSHLDERVRAARLGAGLLLCDGIVLLGTIGLLPRHIARRPLVFVALLALGLGMTARLLPWSRWHDRAPSVLALVQVGLWAIGGAVDYEGLRFYTGLLAVAFIFTGLTQPRGASLLLLPCATAAYFVAHSGSGGWAVRLLILVPVWLLTGELLAAALERQRRTQAHIARLLDATRQLAAALDEAAVAQLSAHLAADLLGADMVEVLVAERPGSSRLVNRGQHASRLSPSDAALDIQDEAGIANELTSAIQRGKPLIVADATVWQLGASTLIRDSGVRSAVFVPLSCEEGCLGIVTAFWRTPRPELRTGLDPLTEHAVAFLANEVARALQRTRTTAELVHTAETDPLTGLANRRTYQQALTRMAAGDAVVLLDLDHFKQVNDSYGHAVGDQVLASFAACLLAAAPRQSNCVARYGGEEFALILAEANVDGAAVVLERLQRQWTARAPLATFSAGIAVHRPGQYATVTIGQADEALYRAKASGRARWVYADQPSEPVGTLERLSQVPT
jgi:diguanylate cyclase (GGDEF)-like protein